jgi:hypothetical protein
MLYREFKLKPNQDARKAQRPYISSYNVQYQLPHARVVYVSNFLQLSDMLERIIKRCLKLLSRNCGYCAPDDFFKFIYCVLIAFICVSFSNFPTDNNCLGSGRANEQATKGD